MIEVPSRMAASSTFPVARRNPDLRERELLSSVSRILRKKAGKWPTARRIFVAYRVVRAEEAGTSANSFGDQCDLLPPDGAKVAKPPSVEFKVAPVKTTPVKDGPVTGEVGDRRRKYRSNRSVPTRKYSFRLALSRSFRTLTRQEPY